ncbi:MAG: DUF2802 domain-containing protein [Pseudomonadota bacterium]
MPLDSVSLALGLLVAAVLGLALGLAACWVAVGRTRASLAEQAARLEVLRRDTEAVAALGARLGERFRRLEQVAAQLADRLGQLELRGEGRPYDHAIALVRHGAADADRLVQNLGLSRGEADLVARLHGRDPAADPPTP